MGVLFDTFICNTTYMKSSIPLILFFFSLIYIGVMMIHIQQQYVHTNIFSILDIYKRFLWATHNIGWLCIVLCSFLCTFGVFFPCVIKTCIKFRRWNQCIIICATTTTITDWCIHTKCCTKCFFQHVYFIFYFYLLTLPYVLNKYIFINVETTFYLGCSFTYIYLYINV